MYNPTVKLRERLIKSVCDMMRDEYFDERTVDTLGGEEYITLLLDAICEEASKCFPHMDYQLMSFDARADIGGDDDYRV